MSQNDAPAAPADDSIDPTLAAASVSALPSHSTVYARTSRVDHLAHLLRHLDSLIFIEIGLAYYHDNLSFLLALRALSQVLYVQPKPSGLIAHGLGPTLVVNLLCIITHLLHDPPGSASRYARGWIHGGLLIDFVGEQGPISRWVLLGYDVMIVVLQLVMLMVVHEKRRLEGSDNTDPEKTQDLAAEEAGIRRSQESDSAATATAAASDEHLEAGIEMDRLLPDGSRPRSGTSSSPEREDGDLIAIINVMESLKLLAHRPHVSRSTSIDTEERAARVRALLLGRLLAERLAVPR